MDANNQNPTLTSLELVKLTRGIMTLFRRDVAAPHHVWWSILELGARPFEDWLIRHQIQVIATRMGMGQIDQTVPGLQRLFHIFVERWEPTSFTMRAHLSQVVRDPQYKRPQGVQPYEPYDQEAKKVLYLRYRDDGAQAWPGTAAEEPVQLYFAQISCPTKPLAQNHAIFSLKKNIASGVG